MHRRHEQAGLAQGSLSRCRGSPRCSSERGESCLEQTELVALGIGQDMPRLVSGLANIGWAGTELEKTIELGILIAIGGVHINVEAGLSLPRLIRATEENRRLRTTEPFPRPNLERTILLAVEHDKVKDVAPEECQDLGVSAIEHEFTDTTGHTIKLLLSPAGGSVGNSAPGLER